LERKKVYELQVQLVIIEWYSVSSQLRSVIRYSVLYFVFRYERYVILEAFEIIGAFISALRRIQILYLIFICDIVLWKKKL
jgi:hypothetical protein